MKFATLLLFALAVSGCHTYMTADIRESLNPEDLPKVQYFLSREVVLLHEIAADERNVVPGHEVRIVQGKRIEEVVFPKGCPGVEVGVSTGTIMMVSFEDGTPEEQNPALPFSLIDGSSEFGLKGGETVTYQGKPFEVYIGVSAGDAMAAMLNSGIVPSVKYAMHGNGVAKLLIDLKTAKVKTRETRVVPGRRVSQ